MSWSEQDLSSSSYMSYALVIFDPRRFFIFVKLQLIYYLYKDLQYLLQLACLHDIICVFHQLPLHLGQLICFHNDITMTLRTAFFLKLLPIISKSGGTRLKQVYMRNFYIVMLSNNCQWTHNCFYIIYYRAPIRLLFLPF